MLLNGAVPNSLRGKRQPWQSPRSKSHGTLHSRKFKERSRNWWMPNGMQREVIVGGKRIMEQGRQPHAAIEMRVFAASRV